MKGAIISLDPGLPVSKYRQIIQSVEDAISRGDLKPGDKIPSINEISRQWKLSRETVVNAYNELRSRGIISSAPGKGYYIDTANIQITRNIFLLFDELNAFKEDLYNAFLEKLDSSTQVDIFFHHFNRKLFDQLILDSRGHYTTFVIMPAMFTGTLPLLQSLPGKVIILDQLPADMDEGFSAIYQNFEKDTYQALHSGAPLISRYQKFTLVYPGGKEPRGQLTGFGKFCQEQKISHRVINSLKGEDIQTGEVYLVIADSDLVHIVKQARLKGLQPGKDIGIISYNDTALKEVVENGITTISTDFRQMGHSLARLAGSKTLERIENPASLIIRGSL